jgi:hypothetical protein
MRNEAFTEFHRIARRQMRPFGTAKPREIGKIRVINSGAPVIFKSQSRTDPIVAGLLARYIRADAACMAASTVR